jgi:DNA-directed RNA polymerase specialized sigma24 family protein
VKTTEARAEQGLRLLCMDQQDDRELVARLREGDWSALDGLYDRYARAVFQRCWRILHERQASWETTQETFAAFLAHLSCRCDQLPREWLFDTCTRLATQAHTEGRR